nr:hypothetical protein [Tanacetum cinerariifolium]
MRPVSNIGANGLNTSTSEISILIRPAPHVHIQESAATITTLADDIRLLQDTTYMSAPKTCNNRRQTKIKDRRRVPRARPNLPDSSRRTTCNSIRE